MTIYLSYYLALSICTLAARRLDIGFWGTMLTMGANAYMLAHYTPFFAALTIWNVLYFIMLGFTTIASAYEALNESDSIFDKNPNSILVFLCKLIYLTLCGAFYYYGGAFNV